MSMTLACFVIYLARYVEVIYTSDVTEYICHSKSIMKFKNQIG